MSPSPENCPALVLNADFRPLSYFPLSLWSWQDAVKAVFLERVSIISEYDREVHSPSFRMKLPSVIALKEYIASSRYPAFTRFNVFLRDKLLTANIAATDARRPISPSIMWCRNPKAAARCGKMLLPPARFAICAKVRACRGNAICIPGKNLGGR